VSAGLALVVAGFIALFLAWNGAAGKDFVEGQLPYLMSGGLVGIGLIGTGLTVVNIQARRADQAELINRLEEILEVRQAEAARPQIVREEPTKAPRSRKRSA
jgi:hypothetical protein